MAQYYERNKSVSSKASLKGVIMLNVTTVHRSSLERLQSAIDDAVHFYHFWLYYFADLMQKYDLHTIEF